MRNRRHSVVRLRRSNSKDTKPEREQHKFRIQHVVVTRLLWVWLACCLGATFVVSWMAIYGTPDAQKLALGALCGAIVGLGTMLRKIVAKTMDDG
jgi:hypothetical protein